LAEKKQTDSYSLLEEDIEAVPGNILVVPHFNGAATPYMDGGAKGTIIGLSLSHTAKDIYKSVMEGVAYEMLGNIIFLEKAGIRLNYLHSTGGGAKSALWMQIKANMLNKELISVQGDEAGTVGSAMLAAVALGQYKNIEDAASSFIWRGTTMFQLKLKLVLSIEKVAKMKLILKQWNICIQIR